MFSELETWCQKTQLFSWKYGSNDNENLMITAFSMVLYHYDSLLFSFGV
jgi:hypothetical protein